MHRPANLTTFEEAQADRLEDLSRTLASLRRAVTTGDRIAIETYCLAFCRRLQPSPIRLDDAEELRALATHLASRVKFGVCERLRKFLIELVSALECQLEIASD